MAVQPSIGLRAQRSLVGKEFHHGGTEDTEGTRAELGQANKGFALSNPFIAGDTSKIHSIFLSVLHASVVKVVLLNREEWRK